MDIKMNDKEILDEIATRLEATVDMDAEIQLEGGESVDKLTLDTSQEVAKYCSKLLYFIWQQRIQAQKLNKKTRVITV